MRTSLALTAAAGAVLAGLSAAPAASAEYYDALVLNDIFTSLQNTFNASVIGVVNRPVSPFAAGLASDTPPGYCGVGLWKRANAGSATTEVEDGDLEASYGGLTVGGDLACFNLNGFDVSVGVLAGGLWGEGKLDTVPGVVDLTQTQAGIYAAFTKGALSGYALVRGGHSEYRAEGLFGVDDGTGFDADSKGISAAVSYTADLGNGMSLIPTLGIDVSTSSFTTLNLDENYDNAAIDIDDVDSTTAYIGATLSKVVLLDDTSAIVPFASATFYYQAETNITGRVEFDNLDPAVINTTQDEKTFIELGIGANYAKLLDGQFGSAKQLTLSGRLDYKFNEDSSALNVTAQARIQF